MAACLTCWAIAIVTRAVLLRGRYRARHSPKVCTASVTATVTGQATPIPAPLDAPQADPTADPVTDETHYEATQSIPLATTAEPVPIEPNLQLRAQQLAQALAGRRGSGTPRISKQINEQDAADAQGTAPTGSQSTEAQRSWT